MINCRRSHRCSHLELYMCMVFCRINSHRKWKYTIINITLCLPELSSPIKWTCVCPFPKGFDETLFFIFNLAKVKSKK